MAAGDEQSADGRHQVSEHGFYEGRVLGADRDHAYVLVVLQREGGRERTTSANKGYVVHTCL